MNWNCTESQIHLKKKKEINVASPRSKVQLISYLPTVTPVRLVRGEWGWGMGGKAASSGLL